MPFETTIASFYREQAERIRALADGFHSPDTKQQLLQIADQYERLAEQNEKGLCR